MSVDSLRPFYGWKIAYVAFLANFMAVGTGFYAINAFLEPLCQQRGWSRTAVNLAPVMGTLFGFGAQLFYGTVVMRVGPRKLMTIGAIISGAAFFCLGQVQGLLGFYVFYTLLYLGNGAYGGIVANTAVNNWFVLNRGKAMGLSTAGMSLSGVVFPFLLMITIMNWDLKAAFSLGGVLVLIISPLAWKVVRDWPEDCGQRPDGLLEDQPLDTIKGSLGKTGGYLKGELGLGNVIRSLTFWRLGLAYSLMMTGAVGVMSQLKPRFVELGFRDLPAMALMSLAALFGAVGKYLWGFLCDRFRPHVVVATMGIMKATGLLIGILARGGMGLYFFIVTFGLGMGGLMSTFPIVTAHVYGRKNFAFVIRFLYLILVLELIGYIIAGQSFDRTGSYTAAYWIFLVMDILAAMLLWGMRKEVAEE